MDASIDLRDVFARCAPRYAAAGFPVFPLAPGSKKPPHGSHGLLEATTDLIKVALWGMAVPNANIGLVTGEISGVTVIDIDPKNYGFETERAFRAEGGFWGDTPVSRTRSGGRHIWFQYHPALVTGADRLGKGIDIRNDGGYVVAPPSIVDGRKYSWLHWPKPGFAPVPEWVIEYLAEEDLKREAKLAERAKSTVKSNRSEHSDLEQRRYKGLASSSLPRLTSCLSSKAKPGRGGLLYTVTGFMKPYVENGYIDEDVVRRAFEGACQSNGLIRENGIVDIRRTMDRAFRHATDQLQDLSQLEDRPMNRRAA